MFSAWVLYQPVNSSQDISVTHGCMRCQRGSHFRLSHRGSQEEPSQTSAPLAPHQPGLRPAFSEGKSHVRPREDAIRPSHTRFCPPSCYHIVQFGISRNKSRRKREQAGKEGVCCPPEHFEASGCFALHAGGSWSWIISWQALCRGCQGVLSSRRWIGLYETLSLSDPSSSISYFSAAILGQALLFQTLQVRSKGADHHSDLLLFSCSLFYSRM